MGKKIAQFDDGRKVINSGDRTFLSKVLNKKGAARTGYFLIDKLEDFEYEYYHNTTAVGNNGDNYFPLVICNRGDTREKCEFCDQAKKGVEGISKTRVGAMLQFYVPDDDTTYLFERKDGYFEDIVEMLQMCKEGNSILQYPFTIGVQVMQPRQYKIKPESPDDEVKDSVRAAFDNMAVGDDLYVTATNAEMSAFIKAGRKFVSVETETTNDVIADDDEEDLPF